MKSHYGFLLGVFCSLPLTSAPASDLETDRYAKQLNLAQSSRIIRPKSIVYPNGTRFEITDIHPDSAFYEQRDTLIGKTATAVTCSDGFGEPGINLSETGSRAGWYDACFVLDSDTAREYYIYGFQMTLLSSTPGITVSSGVNAAGGVNQASFTLTTRLQSGSARNSFNIDDIFDVSAAIQVDPNVIGQSRPIYIVANYDGYWFMKNTAGQWLNWGVGQQPLVAAENARVLGNQEQVIIQSGLTGLPGQFEVFVGYGTDTGDIHYNAIPARFQVLTPSTGLTIHDYFPRKGTAGETIYVWLDTDDDLTHVDDLQAFYDGRSLPVLGVSESYLQVRLPDQAGSGQLIVSVDGVPSNAVPIAIEAQQATTLVSTIVRPATEYQTITYEDQLTVKLPPGLTDRDRQLTVAYVQNPPSNTLNPFGASLAFDVSIDGLEQLNDFIEITVPSLKIVETER